MWLAVGKKQEIKREVGQDEGFAKMVKEGKVRLCPKCETSSNER
eukprot:UN09380